MYTLIGRNVNELYAQARHLIVRDGVRSESRAGPVLAMKSPVMSVYEKPTERVLFDATRDSNPMFSLLESIWMLAGRDDGPWLDLFVKDFSHRFSEEGGKIWGAYGNRWRHHWEHDQLTVIVERLRRDNNDRRVVIAMWDPDYDLWSRDEAKSDRPGEEYLEPRDLPCLAGETILWSPECDLPIEDVAQLFSRGCVDRWPVYTVKPSTGKLTLAWSSNVWKSGKKKVFKITFDDGSIIRATEDHIFLGRRATVTDCFHVKVRDMKSGMRVIATRRHYGPKGHEQMKRFLGRGSMFSNMSKTHREYAELLWGAIPSKHDVHHLDENKTRNSQDNLEIITHSGHSRIHRLGDKNPMRRLSPEQHRVRAAKQSASIKRTWASLTFEERRARALGPKRYTPDNHKIISVEEDGICDVYDFTVPETHNALMGTGVLVHNCNTQIYPRIVDGALDITTTSRSHDIIWGAYGANAVHFSVLQEYLAAAIGVRVGKLYQLSNNWHGYLDVLLRTSPDGTSAPDPYQQNIVRPMPMVTIPDKFLRDCEIFCETGGANYEYANAWFDLVAIPMLDAAACWRKGDRQGARIAVMDVQAADWRLATLAWMNRRMVAA